MNVLTKASWTEVLRIRNRDTRWPGQGARWRSSPVITTNLKRIADLAAKSRLPSIYQSSDFADADGLMAYGPDRADMHPRAATYVDKILKGTKPADLPVEQPTKLSWW